MMLFLRYSIMVLLCISLFACEKIVEVDIKDNKPKYFIEAHIFDELGNNVVYVRKTQSVFDDAPSKGVDYARVTIEDDGKLYSLAFTPSGYYNHPELIGKSGNTYTLRVDVDGQTFNSISIMPNKAIYNDLIVALPFGLNENGDTISPCSEGAYFIFNQFVDIPNEKNYYLFDYNRFETTGSTLETTTDESIYLQNDLVSDGTTGCIPFTSTCFVNDQVVNTIMYNLTEVMYNYYYVLFAVANNGTPAGDVTPQNPITNMEGGALGFFNTAAISRKTIKTGPTSDINPCIF